MTNVIVVVLDFTDLSIPQLIEKGKSILLSMTGNSNFIAPNPLPNPTIAVATTNLNALEAAFVAAQGGGKNLKAQVRLKKTITLKDFSNLRGYVQNIANINTANGEAVAISAGMRVKKISIHVVHDFDARHTKNPGQVLLITKAAFRSTYVWQVSTNPNVEADWKTVGQGTKASFLVSDLTSGTRYYFRVAVVNKDGQNPWSNVLNLIVT